MKTDYRRQRQPKFHLSGKTFSIFVRRVMWETVRASRSLQVIDRKQYNGYGFSSHSGFLEAELQPSTIRSLAELGG
jgi:hypothetical protein